MARKTSDMQIRGHCQICGALQAASAGTVAKHGYTVDHGYFNGVCHGHNYLPIEKDRNMSDKVCADILADITKLAARAGRLEAGTEDPEFVIRHKFNITTRKNDRIEIPFASAPSYDQEGARKSLIWSLLQTVRSGQDHIDMLTKLCAQFHGQPLVVFLKPKAADPIKSGEKRQGPKSVYIAKYQDGHRVYFKTETGFNGWLGSKAWRMLPMVGE